VSSTRGARAPQRLVCLVPSLTEALFTLGLGDRVVGVTDYCVHPAEALAGVTRVGGTKDPDCEAIVRLAPDLVIANREENTERSVRRLRAAGLEVWVTSPKTVREAVGLMEELAALAGEAGPTEEAGREVLRLRRALERAEASRPRRPVPCFCPIWRDPWMTIGGDTYAHDLLRLCGAHNPFAAIGGRRYPRVDRAAIEAAAPEVILLPDEPYRFGPRDVSELATWDLPAARSGRIHLIDGTWVTWYGPRIETALEEISRRISA